MSNVFPLQYSRRILPLNNKQGFPPGPRWTLSQLSYGLLRPHLLKVPPPSPTQTLSKVDSADQKVGSYLSGKCKQAAAAVICCMTGTRLLSGGEAKHSEWQMASRRLWKTKAATARNWAELGLRHHSGAPYRENHLNRGIRLYPHNDPVRFGGWEENAADAATSVWKKNTYLDSAQKCKENIARQQIRSETRREEADLDWITDVSE